ncbi:MAG: triose-phosphate isomerase [Acutalibacteraceae bacterium]
MLPADVVVCVPYIDLHAALEATKEAISALEQKIVTGNKAALLLGEISASMLSAIGVNYAYHWP